MNLTFTNGGFFWFLWALWVISLISIGCNWFTYKFNIRQEMVYGITIIALAFAMIILNIRVLGFQYIAYYFIFYSIGYFTNKYKNLLTTNRVYLSLCFVVWLLMASFWNMHTLPWFLLNIPYIPSTILQYLYRFATAIVAIYFLFSIFPTYFNRLHKGNFILRLGRNSLAVYGLQGVIIYYVCVWVANLWPSMSDGISVIIAFIATTALCMLGVNIGKRNKLSSRLLFGKL